MSDDHLCKRADQPGRNEEPVEVLALIKIIILEVGGIAPEECHDATLRIRGNTSPRPQMNAG